jgi:adenylate cyclase
MISVELIKVADGTQIWGTQLNHPFSDIIEVPEKITFEVSEKLKSEIGSTTKNSFTNPVTNNAESYRLYLKGRYLSDKRSLEDTKKAVECFEKSVCFDPVNVHSYAEIVECYIWLHAVDQFSRTDALIKINQCLSSISKLNQSVDIVQTMYGGVKMLLEWKFEEAKDHLHSALKLNPNSLLARYRYSYLLINLGNFSEALNELKQVMLIDPLSVVTYMRIGKSFYKMGRPESAIIYLKDALELDNTNWETLMILGSAYVETGNFQEALKIFDKCLSLYDEVEALSMIGYIKALEGNKKEALKIIQQIKSRSEIKFNYPLELARIYAVLGEKDLAYHFLECAFEQHVIDLIAIKADPRWTAICHEKRFKEIVLKIGLPTG